MKKFAHLLYYLLLAVALAVVANWVYEQFVLPYDLREHSSLVELSRKPVASHADIVYLGESSNHSYHPDDLDKRKISQMVADYYPNLSVTDMTHDAAHAEVYYALLNHIPETLSGMTVVVTMNLRSFGPDWIYSDLENALQKKVLLLRPRPALVNRFLLAFRQYYKDRQTQVAQYWQDNPLHGAHTYVPDWADEYEGVARSFIINYAFEIDTLTNPRIRDFDNIVRLAEERGWNLVFNIMSENMVLADSLVGSELTGLMERNVRLLTQRYEGMGAVVVNNLHAVDDTLFIDRDWPTEHYAATGRRIVAHNVAKALKTLYPDQYRDAPSPSQLLPQSFFFNDCEDNTPWGQRQTYVGDKSGNHWSRVDVDNPYGTTFETMVSYLPSHYTQVEVHFQYLQPTRRHNATMVLELTGGSAPDTFQQKELRADVVGRWCSGVVGFDLDSLWRDHKYIKLYVTNNAKTPFNIDNISVRFQ